MSLQWSEYLTSWVYLFFRLLGLLCLLPLAGEQLAFYTKLSLAAAFSLVFLPYLSISEGCTVQHVCLEFILGMLLSIPLLLLVEGGSVLGELYDIGRGQTLATAYDSLSQVPQSVTATFARQYVWALLVLAGALTLLIKYFAQSLLLVPVGTAELSRLLNITVQLLPVISYLFNQVLLLFLPWLLVFFLIDLLLLVTGVLIPGLNVNCESMLLKSFAGLLLIYYLSLKLAPQSLLQEVEALTHRLFETT